MQAIHREKCAHALWLIALAWAGPAAQSQVGPHDMHRVSGAAGLVPVVTFIAPNDPGFMYSEYVNATIDMTGASFDRPTVNWNGKQHSPGARINFTSDAALIRIRVDYLGTYSTPGAGLFRLEVDGQLSSTPIGSDVDQGAQEYALFQQASNTQHEFSVVFPYASEVDFLGLELEGGTPGLLAPPSRPPYLYAAYGDSITHGFVASSAADSYPFKVAGLRGWSVVNMGFTGRKIVAADGVALGSLGADCVTVAIGVNDYFGEVTGPTPALNFTNRFNAFLSNLRGLQPAIPVVVLTPVWTSLEGVPNSLGLTVEDYRQLIRDVVNLKAVTDSELYLVEGLGLVPPGLAFFPDGTHPSDAGFDAYANALDAALTAILPTTDSGTKPEPPGKEVPTRHVESECNGRSGNAGVPHLDLRRSRSGQVALLIENSSGVDTIGILVVDPDPRPAGVLPELLDGRAGRTWTAIPARGLELEFPATFGSDEGLLLQVLQLDPSSWRGWSASQILSLRLDG